MSRTLLIIGALFLVGSLGLLLFQQSIKPQTNQDVIVDAPLGEPIITQSVVSSDCQVVITIGANTVTIPTSFDPTIAKCEQYTVSRVSPFGSSVAFEDLSTAGVDAVVSLYDLDTNRVYTLDDYGTESVLDMIFLPNNRLLVLYSQGISGKQTLRLYDVPGLKPLLQDVPAEGDLSSETLNPFVFERNLDDAKGIAKSIRLTGTSVVLVDDFDDVANPLFEISLSEL